MFGEKSIYGQSIINCDAKKRIFLPSFTYAEKDDQLLIIDKKDYLAIYREDEYEKIISEYEKQYLTYDLVNKREADIMLLKIYSEILKKVECDSQKRICLGNTMEEGQIFCIGAKNHLILSKSKK